MFYIQVIALLVSTVFLATLVVFAYLYLTKDLASNNLKRERAAINANAQILIEQLNNRNTNKATELPPLKKPKK